MWSQFIPLEEFYETWLSIVLSQLLGFPLFICDLFIFWVLSPLFVCADNFRLSMEYWQLLNVLIWGGLGVVTESSCAYWVCLKCGTVLHAPFFPGLFFYVYIKNPNPKSSRRPHTTGPKPNQLKTPTPKTQSKTLSPQRQTTINEQNKKKL